MKSSWTLSKSGSSSSTSPAVAEPALSCAFPGCTVPSRATCSICLATRYCSTEHQKAHWKLHKKVCVTPQKKTSAPVPPTPPIPLPLKRSLKLNENFEILEIDGDKIGSEALKQRLKTIARSENLVKLKALAKLCSPDFIVDTSLRVAAWRRILEVLELAMPVVVEKKVRGKKKKKNDPRKLEILDACFALGRASNKVGDDDNCIQYYKRAKEGYEEQLGHNDQKALDATQN